MSRINSKLRKKARRLVRAAEKVTKPVVQYYAKWAPVGERNVYISYESYKAGDLPVQIIDMETPHEVQIIFHSFWRAIKESNGTDEEIKLLMEKFKRTGIKDSKKDTVKEVVEQEAAEEDVADEENKEELVNQQ